MAAKANITINDGQATPVAVTFTPETENGIVYTFAERSGGVAIGFRRLTVSTKLARGKDVTSRAKYTVEMPVTAVVNGVTQLAYTLRANLDVVLPVASTDAERKNLYAFLTNGLNNALLRGALRDLDPVF